jgi:hypothetical protein
MEAFLLLGRRRRRRCSRRRRRRSRRRCSHRRRRRRHRFSYGEIVRGVALRPQVAVNPRGQKDWLLDNGMSLWWP